MYGHVYSSEDFVTLKNGESIEIVLDEPCAYLKIYQNTFKFNIYINDDPNPIVVPIINSSDFNNAFTLDMLTIHKFRIEKNKYMFGNDDYLLQFMWVAFA